VFAGKQPNQTKMESPLFLISSCSFWIVVYYCSHIVDRRNKDHFNTGYISNLHTLGGSILALASIYFDDEAIFPEHIVLCWTAGFFFADLIDCSVRRDTMFFVHAIVGLALLYSCWNSPFYAQRAGSRGFFVELSSPFYHAWKTSKTKTKFRLFCFSFFLCRIVYTPIFLNKMNVTQNSFAILASIAFYLMNLAWFAKGMQMLYNYKESPGRESKDK